VIGRKYASDTRSGDSHAVDRTRWSDENVIQSRARQTQAPMECAASRSGSRPGPHVLECARSRNILADKGFHQRTGWKGVEVSRENLRAATVIVEQPEQMIRRAVAPSPDQAKVRAEDIHERLRWKPYPNPVHDVRCRRIAREPERPTVGGSAEPSPH
jgi:hypothetical protein